MEIKLFDSELKVMEILWREGETTAKALAEALAAQIGWSKTTTYTVIKKCLDKGAIERVDPGFVCRAAMTRDEARAFETTELINKLYGGSKDQLIASLLGGKPLTSERLETLRRMVLETEGTE